jgi:hypothetical protein
VELYVLEVAEKGMTIAEALSAVGELLMDARLLDQDWKTELAVQMALIQMTHEELQEMDVPQGMAEFHEAVLAGTQDCHDAMDYAASGLDNLDLDALETATALINSCGAKIAELPDVLEAYMAQYE